MSNKTPIQKPSAQVQQADAFWKHVFVEGPYTAFVMIDYLRSKATVNNWNEVLTSGWSNQKGLVAFSQAGDKQEAIMKDADLSRIWAGKTGRCTSFAVKVMSLLEKQSPGTFKFKVYDIGHHRVARCEKTAVLIDSSSKQGAFPLPEGEWVRIEGSSWKWSDGKSKFERVEGSSGVKESRTILSKEEALVTCLLELPRSASIPTLLRSVDPETKGSVFHALIRWVWKSKSLEIQSGVEKGRKVAIKFGGGTDTTNIECAGKLANAVKQWGGPHGERQWAAVQPINRQIWDAAAKVWGNPQWTEI